MPLRPWDYIVPRYGLLQFRKGYDDKKSMKSISFLLILAWIAHANGPVCLDIYLKLTGGKSREHLLAKIAKDFKSYLDPTRYKSKAAMNDAAKYFGRNQFASAKEPKFLNQLKEDKFKKQKRDLANIATQNDPSKLPFIDSKKIKIRKVMKRTNGINHDGLILGEMGGVPVVIKFDTISKTDGVSETAYAGQIYETAVGMYANKLGLGPTVFGIYQDGTRYGIVVEGVPGTNAQQFFKYSARNSLQVETPSGLVTPNTFEDIRDTANRMDAGDLWAGGRYSDFQFKITPEGRAILFDFGAYHLTPSRETRKMGRSSNSGMAESIIRCLTPNLNVGHDTPK